MRNSKIRWTLMAMLVLVGVYVTDTQSAAMNTGNDLLPACKAVLSETDLNRQSLFCLGFVDGFLKGSETTSLIVLPEKSYADWVKKRPWCTGNATIGQIIRVFVKSMEDHPEKLHYDPGFLLAGALKQAFPCK